MSNRRRRVLLRCREPVGKLLPHRLEQRPTAVADHPAARAGGVAGIAQVEPGDAHPAASCGGEQAAYWSPATGALGPESTRVKALDCVGGLAVFIGAGGEQAATALTAAMVNMAPEAATAA